MTGFYCMYRTGGGEICLAHNIGCSPKIRSYTNTFENRSGSNEALKISDAKVVSAGLEGRGNSSCAMSAFLHYLYS